MPFLTSVGEKSPDTQIWHCDPLLVVHPEDGVVYAMKTDVEFVPGNEGFGSAVALTPKADGWTPEIEITDWHDLPDSFLMPYRLRPGRILFGHDKDGFSFAWYIDRAADEYLTRMPDEPEPVEEEPS